MAKKFLCSNLFADCAYETEDEHEEAVLKAAEEHLKTNHPGEAIERERVRTIIRSGAPYT